MTGAWRGLARRLGIEHPLMLAPLAGGPSTPALAAAVSGAGGWAPSAPPTSRPGSSATRSPKCAG
jgi:nitronate monooxygenase